MVLVGRCETATDSIPIRNDSLGSGRISDSPRGSHASVSQLSLAASCGEAYRRRYIEGEKDASGLPAEAGTAVHTAVEVWESSFLDAPYSTLPASAGREIHELAKQSLRDVPGLRELRYYGKQDADWWFTEGLKVRVDNYLAYRADELDAGWTWERGLGASPFELELDVSFADRDFKGFIDQVLLDPRGRIVIRDLKCGREKPWHAMQLEFYILGIVQQWEMDQDDVYGQVLYLNGKKPKVQVVAPRMDEANADRMVADLVGMIDAGLFPVTGPFTDSCGFCSFRPDCPWGAVGQANTRLKGSK